MTTMKLGNMNLGSLRLPGIQPAQKHSNRGLWFGLGGTLVSAALGYLAFRIIERRPPSGYRRNSSPGTQKRRPVAVKAATISPQAPISTNGELAQSERNAF